MSLIGTLGCADTLSPPSVVLLSLGDVTVVTEDPAHIGVDYTITNYLGKTVGFPTCGDYPNAGFEKQVGATWQSFAFLRSFGESAGPILLDDRQTLATRLVIPGTEPGTYRVTLSYWTESPGSSTMITSPSFTVD